MSRLHKLIGTVALRRPSPVIDYGVTLLLIGIMTFVRFLAPAYVAPFLLYIPGSGLDQHQKAMTATSATAET